MSNGRTAATCRVIAPERHAFPADDRIAPRMPDSRLLSSHSVTVVLRGGLFCAPSSDRSLA